MCLYRRRVCLGAMVRLLAAANRHSDSNFGHRLLCCVRSEDNWNHFADDGRAGLLHRWP